MPISYIIRPALILSILVIIILTFGKNLKFDNFEKIGRNDLIAFWSASQALTAGKNPYDSGDILKIQQTLNGKLRVGQAYLNPPWTFAVFSFFIFNSFETTKNVWILCNLIFLILGLYCVSLITRCSNLNLLYAAILYSPFYYCLSIGQLSIFLFAVFSLAILLVFKKWYFCSGIIFSILSIKFHLFSCLFVFMFFWAIQNKKFKCIFGLVAGLLLLLVYPIFYSNQIYLQWLSNEFNPISYMHSSLATPFKVYLVNNYTEFYKLPNIIILILGLSATLYVCIKSKLQLNYLNINIYLCLSLMISPHIWPYDFTLLLGICSVVFLQAFDKIRKKENRLNWTVIFILILVQFIVLIYLFSLKNYLELCFFFPIITYFILLYIKENNLLTITNWLTSD